MDYFNQPLEKKIRLTNQNDDNLVYIQVKITDLTKLFKDKIENLERKVKDLPNLKKMNEYHSQIKNLENKITSPDLKLEEKQQLSLEKLIDTKLNEKIDISIEKKIEIDPSIAKIKNSIQQIEQNVSNTYKKEVIDEKLKSVDTSKLKTDIEKQLSSSLNSKMKTYIEQELKNKNSLLIKKISEVDGKLNKKIKDNILPVEKKIEKKIDEIVADVRKFYGFVTEGLDKYEIKIEQIDHELAKLQEKK